MGTPQLEDTSRRLIIWLFVALATWGVYLAVGAYLYKHDVRQAADRDRLCGCVPGSLGVAIDRPESAGAAAARRFVGRDAGIRR